jgi:transmembrane sensor
VTKKNFLELLDKYLAGNTSEAENDLLFRVYQQMEDQSDLKLEEPAALQKLEERLIARFASTIQQQPDRHRGRVANFYTRYRAGLNIAASVILAGIAVLFYTRYQKSTVNALLLSDSSSSAFVTFDNRTTHKVKVYFPDRSYVELQSGGHLIYKKDFSGHQRKVYLDGVGFFQVTKDHSKPFIVYTDRLVTKVLGTSFTIDSRGVDGPASVTVITGRVAVFNKNDFKAENLGADLTGGMLLTPNHVAALTPENKFIKKLADQPVIIKDKQEISFVFDNTPVAEVFDRLEQAYNIKVIYDHDKLQNCSLSVNMGQEDFYHKLDVICRTLNLTYRPVDGNVYVSGNGCAY